MEELNKKDIEEKEKVSENVVTEKNEDSSDTLKVKIGTVGNFVLAAFIILIIGTGGLTYYLIHSAKDDYDKQYNEIVSNLTNEENIVEVEEEQEKGTVANIIDSAISEAASSSNPTTTTDENTKKLMNESLVVLYNGLILDTTKMDEVALQYIDSKNEESDKYIITYYSYENYSFKESKLGIFSSQLYDGLVKIDSVGKVAISEDYDAIPRDVKVVNTVPTIVSDNNPKLVDYDSIKTLIVDLDGNGADEYILILANKSIGFSKITLIDSKGSKVADLASIEKSKWKKDTGAEYYLSINNVEVIDVDNDGIMEIVVEIPHATGDPTVSLLKYSNGVLSGKTGIECSLLSE
ncbi:MAG: hypothetical protein IJW20_00850 [Clostridia bacterium]|nr:hypothetical protein [Clostridia bacterium]